MSDGCTEGIVRVFLADGPWPPMRRAEVEAIAEDVLRAGLPGRLATQHAVQRWRTPTGTTGDLLSVTALRIEDDLS